MLPPNYLFPMTMRTSTLFQRQSEVIIPAIPPSETYSLLGLTDVSLSPIRVMNPRTSSTAQRPLTPPKPALSLPSSPIFSKENTPPTLSEEPRLLDIARFAYAPQPSMSRSRSASVRSSASVEPIPERPIPKVSKNKRGTRIVAQPPTYSLLPTEDLEKLLKCPCCDALWTTRKAVKAKLTHIKSCSKKHFHSEELVHNSILKELARPATRQTSAGATSKGKGKQSADISEAVPIAGPSTLLDQLLEETAPKKKSRKVTQPVVTVQSLADTGDAIRHNAQKVLGAAVTWPIDAISAAVNDFPPATQVFAPSVLQGNRTVRRGVAFGSDSSEDEGPPPTQVFAPSKLVLGSKLTRSLTSVLRSDDDLLPPRSKGPYAGPSTRPPEVLASVSTASGSGSTLNLDASRFPPPSQPSSKIVRALQKYLFYILVRN